MIYQTDRIMLQPLTRGHLETEQYWRWMQSPEVTRHNSHGLFPQTKADMESFIDSFESGRDLVWAIHTLGDVHLTKNSSKGYTSITPPNYIGNISLQRINWMYRSAELAILIGDTDYWNKGISTEACRLVLAHGFDRLNLHRIWTGTSGSNIGMQKVAGKIGMIPEGEFRDGMYLNSKYENVKCYAILKDEWDSMPAADPRCNRLWM